MKCEIKTQFLTSFCGCSPLFMSQNSAPRLWKVYFGHLFKNLNATLEKCPFPLTGRYTMGLIFCAELSHGSKIAGLITISRWVDSTFIPLYIYFYLYIYIYLYAFCIFICTFIFLLFNILIFYIFILHIFIVKSHAATTVPNHFGPID